MGRRFWVMVAVFLLSQSLLAKDIVVGVELVPKRNHALVFTPIVLPDLFSAKMAYEYRVHDHVNLVFPLEAKWMDYGGAIEMIGGWAGKPAGFLKKFYDEDELFTIGWNFNFSQLKISSGIGVKYFPLSDSMSSAFFINSFFMVGYEHFYDYNAEKPSDSAVFTGVLTFGYRWVMGNRFMLGFEGGGEYTWHTNPIEVLPVLINGFMPILQFSLGFTI